MSRVESRYLAKFDRLRAAGTPYVFRGNRLLVEVLPKIELKTSSGLIISTGEKQIGAAEDMAPRVGIVLDVGEGYYNDDTGAPMPGEIKPGYVVMLPSIGDLQYRSTWPGLNEYVPPQSGIAIVTEAPIPMYWCSVADFEEYQAVMNGQINEGTVPSV